MVDKIQKSTEEPFLVGFYRYEYGFAVDDAFSVINNIDKSHIVMKKTIVPDPKLAYFPFTELPTKQGSTKKRGVYSMYSAEMDMGSTFGGTLSRRQRKTRHL